jgi:hypothetical protein
MDTPALVPLTFDDGLRCQFERAVPTVENRVFLDALRKYSGGEFDPATLGLLGKTPT